MMIDLSVAALGTGADHGGDTSTVTNTAPVNFTACNTSDSASDPLTCTATAKQVREF